MIILNELDSTCGISDEELTWRFKESIRIDNEIRKIKGLPIAKYDDISQRAYLEYPDGRHEYVDHKASDTGTLSHEANNIMDVKNGNMSYRRIIMIDIEKIREYYMRDLVFVTEHASERYRQRGIKARDVRNAVQTGEIIEQYPDDYPFPSCLILGYDANGKCLHVCMSDEGSASRIITAYYPDEDKWSDDFRIRKETV